MLRFDTIASLRQHLAGLRVSQSIGLVPTMGALHDGHLTLIQQARQQADVVVCSIFVNPVQFNNADDLARYPRTLDADCALLETVGCDIVFAPSVDEMYPAAPSLTLNFGALETVMEGAFRPGHFNGVGLVVAKLFNIVQPDKAFFGQKDLQQVAVIRSLIRNLSFPVELVRSPTVREADGLAMSSRNRNLTPDERDQATTLFAALTLAHDLLADGQTPAQAKAAVGDFISARPAFRLEYIEIANADTLMPADEVLAPGQTAICIAAHLGKVRLIDNLVF
ncbi:pantoate--beta-alanine ligase [Spirosoma rhododendri]|uniref:Pantothenate synthetase n=1 Tax=Spirosoma rhododendri TaxID=2728024 RepID=A0A7L5DNV1_9BACT|nr:pantoate--beta-alanine ligase [Spirosoma rhododendri]QJD78873.1 pantoate--beta-alanine ligase [Spirosoma rhododendri]